MFNQRLINVLQGFVRNADELDLKWKREADDLFSLQIFFKTNSRILIENKLYFTKETVATDLANVLTTVIQMSTEIAPGISLKIDGIPGIENRTYSIDELLKPSNSLFGFTPVVEEEEEEEWYEEETSCSCPSCTCSRDAERRAAEEAVQTTASIEEVLGTNNIQAEDILKDILGGIFTQSFTQPIAVRVPANMPTRNHPAAAVQAPEMPAELAQMIAQAIFGR